ncbi:MAG TPA: hypothetical protein VJ729_13965 [Nitrososphaeraceae archaeon]|nr:hypothetical protein [Nitrososphaeraceae archaeon]
MYNRRALEYHLSVPQAVKTILASNNLYFQALSSGIANYTALAQKIKIEVEKITGIEVQIGTIVVAIKRFADTLIKEQEKEDKQYINDRMSGARLSLTGSIIDVDFEDTAYDEISNILDEYFEKESGSYNIFQTNKQLRLFAEDIEEIRHIVSTASKRFDGKIKEGLSKITITLPSSAVSASALDLSHEERERLRQKPDYNILSLVSDVLYNNQISLYNAFFDSNEIVLILNNKDAAKAYELLRANIST